MNKNIPFIRVNKLCSNRKVLTNIFGESIVLNNSDFSDYVESKLDINTDLYKLLEDKYFIKKDEENYIKNGVMEYKKRFGINFIGPTLHIMVLTKGCNHQCKYCHASADYRYADNSLQMTEETAKKVVDIILSSPSENLTIEFQGGEPLVNIELIDFIIEYAEEKNKELKKNINYALVSNLTLIDEKVLDKLFSYPNFTISTSLDGDKQTHDFNRLLIGEKGLISSFDSLKEKIELIRMYEKEKGRKILYGAMGVITRKTLKNYKELVDTYIELGFESIFLKKINGFGYSSITKNVLGYSSSELEEFYMNYFNYLIELDKKGTQIRDGFLNIILGKILKPEKTNFMDLRTPCGAGIGQIAYDYTGKIYTCDEGRMIEDDTFQIGDTNSSLEELIQNETVGAMMDASTVESLACDVCAYAPFCGVCPIESYEARGNIYTNQVFDSHCKFFMFLFNYVFKGLSDKNSDIEKFLQKQVK